MYLRLIIERNVFKHLHPLGQNKLRAQSMENVGDSSNGKAREVKIKGVRGISLRACVAKVAGWTFEKANSTTSQEASTNKTQ